MPAKTNRISFQGEPGANSDTACRNVFPEMEPLPCPTFEDAFNAVETGKADLAMIPIENTIAGRVADIHHLLAGIAAAHRRRIFPADPLPADGAAGRQASKTSRRSTAISTRSANAARSSAAIAGSRWWPATRRARPSIVARRATARMAALAPRLAATLYGLDIVAENVEDTENNVTRFVVLSKTRDWAARRSADELMMTTFVFRVHNIPAALYKAMGGFATNGVNMTKLESYQLGGKFYRDAVLCRHRGPSRRRQCRAGAEGAELLLARGAHPRRLQGARVPRHPGR